MKAFAVWLSVTVAPISLASAFVPRTSRFTSPGPLLTKRVTPFYSVIEDATTAVTDVVASIHSGSEEDPMSDTELKLVFKVLGKLKGAGVKEIHDSVVKESDTDAHELVGTQAIVEELDAPAGILTPEQLAEVAPALEAKEKGAHKNSIIDLLYNVVELLIKSRIADKKEVLAYDTYPRHKEYPDVSLEPMMKLLYGVPPRQYFFSLKKIGRLIKRSLRLSIGLISTKNAVEEAETYEGKFKAMFSKKTKKTFWGGTMRNPLDLVPSSGNLLNTWDEDKEFARQFLNGVNPVMIQVVKDVDTQLTSEIVQFFGGDHTIDLHALADDKRLLFATYEDLMDLKKEPHDAYPNPYNTGAEDQPRYFQAPVVVFQLSRDRQELEVLGIQLDRTKDANVYTAETSDENTWLMAKTCVTSADSQIHEWVTHLGKTHLTMEPLIIAIHNTLQKSNHKVFTFVEPMTRDTLFLNWAARFTLAEYGENSFGDYVTSVGTGQFMQLIKKYWSTYDFFECSGFSPELEKRGFDASFDIPCYLFREDGKLIWEAYGKFAANFVDEIYATDEEVKADAELQEWAIETTEKAKVKGFPESFDDKLTLVKTLQTLGWISVNHAAVNFPQYDYYGVAPNKPLGIRKSMTHFEAQGKDVDRDWIFKNVNAKLDIAKETLQVVRALTLPSNFCIDNLSKNYQTRGKVPYEMFQNDLKKIGDKINDRNKENKSAGKAVYHYLHPSVVPASIDI